MYAQSLARDLLAPIHWIVGQKPTHALVQHRDTKRYSVMEQLPGDDLLPCDDCIAPPEVFRLPVQDQYAYFVFAYQQGLDGCATISQAQQVAQSLPIAGDLRRLIPG